MTEDIYIEQILPKLLEDFYKQSLTLCYNIDSIYISKYTTTWAKQYYLPVLTLPRASSNLSIFESLANPLKRTFYNKHCIFENADLSYFRTIFEQEFNQGRINSLYDSYLHRLQAIRVAQGQMTKY